MIAKRVDMRDAAKSRATRLAKYVPDELGRTGRMASVVTTNCISDDAVLAAKKIEICQAKNTRAKDDETYHLLLSFSDGERPEMEQMQAMADDSEGSRPRRASAYCRYSRRHGQPAYAPHHQ